MGYIVAIFNQAVQVLVFIHSKLLKTGSYPKLMTSGSLQHPTSHLEYAVGTNLPFVHSKRYSGKADQ